MRIREDGKHAHRTNTIEQAAEFWDCNKTTALMKSADFSVRMDERIQDILTRDYLNERQRRDIANTLSVPGVYEIKVHSEHEVLK
ncbi:DUF7692 domain-containing protein [Halosimplex amylolyticum]|uniref:DUF7692 domain-containing protein n=1 Tax=Halosimplex amylolyticum TaxID=3396616 RepID=UPI003F55652A